LPAFAADFTETHRDPREAEHSFGDNQRLSGAEVPRHIMPQSPRMSAFGVPAQLVDATQALNLSAGVSYFKVSRGRSLS
jgi:hypothetical protein